MEYKLKNKLSLDDSIKYLKKLCVQRYYEESLTICLQITHIYPKAIDAWRFAAINCIHLARWQDVINYAQSVLKLEQGRDTFGYDTLALAYGQLGQWDEVRHYGLQALNIRARHFSSEPVIPLPELKLLPPLPSTETRERNIIAFSLFGHDSKYCETAVLNVQEQPNIFPHWVCRFYVDDSVPGSVINRLRAGGGQIMQVDGAALQWPGPMWRLLALNDPQAHRILFRDADSLISQREAGAVEQWITSGKRFHMMRDAGSHTELILAGLWGVVAGSLPPLDKLMQHFLSKPLTSQYFADQAFLRQYVWPYAKSNLMQHDSVFGFMNSIPFPDKKLPDNLYIGSMASLPYTTKTNLKDGTQIDWGLYRIENQNDKPIQMKLICSYSGVVKKGTVSVCIPKYYEHSINQGAIRIRLIEDNIVSK